MVGIQARVWAALHAPKPVAQLAAKDPRDGKEAPPVREGLGPVSWTVSAVGVTPEKAYAVAQEKARQKLLDYLAKQNPPISWEPSPEFLQAHNFIKQTPSNKKIEAEGAYECVLQAELSSQLCQDIIQAERETLASERQWQAAKVFGVLLALLVAVGGYFYLDEATKGYYTVLLRLGALTLVGVVGLVVWLALK